MARSQLVYSNSLDRIGLDLPAILILGYNYAQMTLLTQCTMHYLILERDIILFPVYHAREIFILSHAPSPDFVPAQPKPN